MEASFLVADHLRMTYQYGKTEVVALEDVSFTIERNKITTITGPSGCGKSTILKMIMGITKPTGGSITVDGRPINRVGLKMAAVFQTSALLPWLTVQKNVEIVLEKLETDEGKRVERALRYLKMVGLDGFEEAYPKELSGGMRQRVSFARALATGPDLLIMDEPFVNLDVFSAEALREELLDLWENPDLPPRTVIMVTHNVDEAVQMSDKIIILGRRPSRVLEEMPITLRRPRNIRSDEFYQSVDSVITAMSR
ncbi:MAG: ABC transporter ATP-binding protein [Candidatus Thermoplasmatota archaeon]|jgi:NitT/TauT family transport system ATP-binding protein|nr:ABC transporter ATP-binding protein [Candidatus Thermoplasmatota archaeon]MCL5793948.1 ABC transporter ATP-binding protein [Candidatus Thermoplasmatota archaeon]